MKIIIFGASGSIGKKLVTQALAQGHRVTAFVRDPAKLGLFHSRLELEVGDVLDEGEVENGVKGHDAVFCVLGAGRKGGVRAAGTKNIIQAMEKTGVRRLICQSTLGVGDSWQNLNAFWKYVMFGFLLRPAYVDHVQQENHIKQSTLDWTIIRPGAFVDGEVTGQYRHGFSTADRSMKLKISRQDVADFLLRQLEDSTYLHKSPGVSY